MPPLPVDSLLKFLWDTVYTAPNKSYVSVSKATKEKGVRCVTPPSFSSPLLFWKLFQIIFSLVGLDIQNVECKHGKMARLHLFWETFRHLLLWALTKAIRKPRNIYILHNYKGAIQTFKCLFKLIWTVRCFKVKQSIQSLISSTEQISTDFFSGNAV